jgi:RND superfamily putative drug exporter
MRTGTLTSPKAIDPVQIARGINPSPFPLPVFSERTTRKRLAGAGCERCALGSEAAVNRDSLIGLFARLVISLRFLLVPAWIAAAAASAVYLPGLGSGQPLELGGLVPKNAEAIRVEQRSAELFQVPLTADTLVVQRDPQGLSRDAQARTVALAVATSKATKDPGGIAFALPITNALGLFPSSREQGTTAITYLFFGPEATLAGRVEQANLYAGRLQRPDDALVGVTGPAPARFRQYLEIASHLKYVEAGTVLLILLVVGLTFRALGAALLTLFAAGIAFTVASGAIPWVGKQLGVSVPQEVEPLVVALTLGIVTDYAVFYLASGRRRLLEGMDRVEAARASAERVTPIVGTAGLIVVAGTAALLVGELEFFRAFGPALALTAAVSLLVAVTLVPALLALFGRLLFWPGLRTHQLGTVEPGDLSSPVREAAARFVSSLPVAALLVVLCSAVLFLAATGVRHTELAFRLITGLPSDTQERRAAEAAGRGFAPGVLAPTIVLVEGDAIADYRDQLASLQDALAKEPGVAAVIGPKEQVPQAPKDLFVSAEGNAARFAVIFDTSPLGSPAIHDVRRLEDDLPALMRRAGLGQSKAGLAGQTQLASETVDAVVGSSIRVGAVVLAVNFLLLALFLRALVAPLYLLAASVASVAATLGLTTYVFQDLLGHTDLTYYVPFATGVLLVSLGSDYNVYVVGRIWEELRVRKLRDAIAVAAPRASKAISIAGVALAFSLATLAIIPLDGFREFAFMMCVGVLIETFVVRSLLIPALISLFGSSSTWPGRIQPPLEPGDETA